MFLLPAGDSLAMSHSVCQNLSEPQESVQQVNVGSRVRMFVGVLSFNSSLLFQGVTAICQDGLNGNVLIISEKSCDIDS